jgi:predicted membrane protein
MWFIGWVLATVAGLLVGSNAGGNLGAVARDAISRVEGDPIGAAALGFITGVWVGVVTGAMQWYVMRQRVYRSGWWILASTLGWTVGVTIGFIVVAVMVKALGQVVGRIIGGAIAGAVNGTMIGAMQWYVLRQKVYRSSWWIVGSVLGGSLGWFAGEVMVIILGGNDNPVLSWNAAWMASGTLSGAVTGLFLIWLLQKPISNESTSRR